MAEPVRASALAGVRRGTFGAPGPDGPAVQIRERRPGVVLIVNGAPGEATLGEALGARPRARHAFDAFGATFLWTGPGQWLAVAADEDPAALRARLESALAGTDATVSDLGHARTVIRLSGPGAVAVLASGCPLDLEAWIPGDCGTTLLGHHSVTVHRVDDEGFDLYLMRSFALDAWDWLVENAAEHGGEVLSPD